MKLLHCADLHLDSPFATLRAADGAEMRRSVRAAFAAMISYIREEEVPLVLIAGDVFEREYATRDTADLMAQAFASCPDTRFVVSPGNHDPYTRGSLWAACEMPENVYIFNENAVSCFPFDDLGVDVYGYAFTDVSLATPRFDGIAERVARRGDRLALLCAHGDLFSPLSPYCPLSPALLAAQGFDYAALGHIHMPPEPSECEATHYAYSGCLTGRDFGESGLHGALLCDIERRGGRTAFGAEKIIFSKKRFESLVFDASGAQTAPALRASIAAFIRSAAQSGGFDADTSLRVRVEGEVAPDASFDPETLARELETVDFTGSVAGISLTDATVPLLDASALEADMTLRGAFFRRLEPALRSADPDERDRAARALRIGLAALRG